MEIQNKYMSEEMKFTDTAVGEQIIPLDDDAEKSKKRAAKKDRSDSKYSEEAFMALPRLEQLALADKYWMGRTDEFDDGTFQFSYTHFTNICQILGFKKGVVDTQPDTASEVISIEPSSVIYIDHGTRGKTEVKKLTFAKTTINKIDQLLGDQLSNVERSKVIDVILSEAFDEKLVAKREGKFGVAYRPVAEERLL